MLPKLSVHEAHLALPTFDVVSVLVGSNEGPLPPTSCAVLTDPFLLAIRLERMSREAIISHQQSFLTSILGQEPHVAVLSVLLGYDYQRSIWFQVHGAAA